MLTVILIYLEVKTSVGKEINVLIIFIKNYTIKTAAKILFILLLFQLTQAKSYGQCKPVEENISIKKRERLQKKCERKKRRKEKRFRRKLIRQHRKNQSKDARKRMKKNKRRDKKRKNH